MPHESIATARPIQPPLPYPFCIFRAAGLAVLGLLTSACTTTTDIHGYQTRSYFGWLQVVEHQHTDQPKPRIERVKAAGIKLERGLSVGYFDDSVITLPDNCHLVVVAKDIHQLNEFFKAYPQLAQREMKPCIKPLDF